MTSRVTNGRAILVMVGGQGSGVYKGLKEGLVVEVRDADDKRSSALVDIGTDAGFSRSAQAVKGLRFSWTEWIMMNATNDVQRVCSRELATREVGDLGIGDFDKNTQEGSEAAVECVYVAGIVAMEVDQDDRPLNRRRRRGMVGTVVDPVEVVEGSQKLNIVLPLDQGAEMLLEVDAEKAGAVGVEDDHVVLQDGKSRR
jgi:predicted deacylase